ncbi:MAG: hypothetical protein RLO50_11585 [Azospirillaceae bacterium]
MTGRSRTRDRHGLAVATLALVLSWGAAAAQDGGSGGDAPAAGSTDAATTDEPMGERDFNPLDIRPVDPPDAWEGQVRVQQTGDGGFAVFESYAYGLRAAAILLRNYKRLHGIDALVGPDGITGEDGVITRWSPESDHNATQAYVDRVSDLTGFGATQVIDLEHGPTVAALIHAMTRVELGLADSDPLPYTADDMAQALSLADFPEASSGGAPGDASGDGQGAATDAAGDAAASQ